MGCFARLVCMNCPIQQFLRLWTFCLVTPFCTLDSSKPAWVIWSININAPQWGDSLLNCSSHADITWHWSHNSAAQELAQIASVRCHGTEQFRPSWLIPHEWNFRAQCLGSTKYALLTNCKQDPDNGLCRTVAFALLQNRCGVIDTQFFFWNKTGSSGWAFQVWGCLQLTSALYKGFEGSL